DADALRADQAHDLLDLLQEHFRRLVEEKMRLVEKEDEFGLVGIAHFGKLLEQFGQKPQQERGVEPRIVHQLVGGENVHIAAAVAARAHQILDVEGGLAEEFRRPLVFQYKQGTLNRADRGGGNVAEFRGEVGGVLGDIDEQRLQVLQIEEQEPLLVGDAE